MLSPSGAVLLLAEVLVVFVVIAAAVYVGVRLAHRHEAKHQTVPGDASSEPSRFGG